MTFCCSKLLSSKACTYKSPKKVLDNLYNDMITSLMLPRQPTLSPHHLAKLTPSPSHSCSLFALFSALPSFRINHLQPLLQNTRGRGYPSEDVRCTEGQKCHSASPLFATHTHSVSRKSFPCHSYANTRDRGATPPATHTSVLATSILFALCFHELANPFSRNSFPFTSIQNPRGVGSRVPLMLSLYLSSLCVAYKQPGRTT